MDESVYDKLIYVQAHCDSRVLHTPDVCVYCDMYPEAQERRKSLGVAFTNQDHNNLGKLLPCPAMRDRGWDSINGWGGNQPQNPNATEDEIAEIEAVERPSSVMFYGSYRDRIAEARKPKKGVQRPLFKRIISFIIQSDRQAKLSDYEKNWKDDDAV